MSYSASPTDYSSWSREQLIARLQALELSPNDVSAVPPSTSTTSPLPSPAPTAAPATPAISLRKSRALPALQRQKQPPSLKHLPLRKIALKFSYLGGPYSGLAIQPDSPLPTVEGVLLQALEKSGLINFGEGWDGCGFARCGRTDRGVSAAGQVVNLWVRSRVDFDEQVHAPRRAEDHVPTDDDSGFWSPPAPAPAEPKAAAAIKEDESDDLQASTTPFAQKAKPRPTEFPYVSLLNRLLPPTIRILAWSPLPPSSEPGAFDARHSCTHRHYKYFFTLASTPSPFSAGERPLDIDAMRQAASYLEGEHDFRNFCKVDGSKQIVSHVRQVYAAKISAVPSLSAGPLQLSPYSHISPTSTAPSRSTSVDPPTAEGSYFVLDLLGRAFLYHQVRHIMAVLFLVGAGLEQPEVVQEMFTWPGKPAYEMASDQPLLLWDCGFPEGVLDWQYGPLDRPSPHAPSSSDDNAQEGKVRHSQEDSAKTSLALNALLSTAIQSSHLTSLLHAHFLSSFLALHPPPPLLPPPQTTVRSNKLLSAISTPLGANSFKLESLPAYTPLEKRTMGDPPEVANKAWRVRMEKKGFGLKMVGGKKVVKMDLRDLKAGQPRNGTKWVEPEDDAE